MGTRRYVGTAAFNMAGEQEGKVKYLKNSTIYSVLSNQPFIGKAIVDAHINGPGANLMAYYRWSNKSGGLADHLGQAVSSFSFNSLLGKDTVRQAIGQIEGVDWSNVELNKYKIGAADFDLFVERFMMTNYPDAYGREAWEVISVSVNPISAFIKVNQGTLLPNGLILYNDIYVTYVASDYDPKGEYLSAEYSITEYGGTPPIVIPPQSDPGWVSGAISTAGYTGFGSESQPDLTTSVSLPNLNETNVWYSDGRPGSSTITNLGTATSFTPVIHKYRQQEPNKQMVAGAYGSYENLIFHLTGYKRNEVITYSGISTRTFKEGTPPNQKTITEYTQTTFYRYNVEHEVQRSLATRRFIVQARFNSAKMLMYKYGTGNASLDAIIGTKSSMGRFFSPLPVRINNAWMQDRLTPNVAALVRKGYKKMTSGGKMDKLQEKLSENPDGNSSIDDLDFVYVVPGSSIRTKERDALRCIYSLLKLSYETEQANGKLSIDEWLTLYNKAREDSIAYGAWLTNGGGTGENFSQRPPKPTYPPDPVSSLVIRDAAGFNVAIQWTGLERFADVGVGRNGAKAKDCWVHVPGISKTVTGIYSRAIYRLYPESQLIDFGFISNVYMSNVDEVKKLEAIDIYFQERDDYYIRFRVWGFEKITRIHEFTSTLSAVDAFLNRKNNESEANSFIVPLHKQIYEDLGLIAYTQATLGILHIHVNWYVEIKEKWYESGFFQILLIIVVIVVAVYTGYIGPESMGLMGSNAAVGVAITGVAAVTTTTVIVGAIANAAAAMVVGALITQASIAVLGEKVGAIVGSILSFMVLNWRSLQDIGKSLTSGDWMNQLTSPQSLVRIAVAGSGPVSNILQANARALMIEQQEMLQDYEKDLQSLKDLTESVIHARGIDMEALANAIRHSLDNSPPDFFERTLMTGSDIAELTMDVVSEFTNTSLIPQLPGVKS